MKKFIFLLMLGVGLMALQPVFSQASTLTGTSGLSLDTITNADATSFKTGKTKESQLDVGVKVTKISGTIAGSVKWEVSIDNTTFYTIATDTLTDASNNYAHTFWKNAGGVQGSAKWVYQRVTVTTTGTSVLSASVKAWDHN